MGGVYHLPLEASVEYEWKMIMTILEDWEKKEKQIMKKEDKFGLRSEICTLSGALYVVSASETQLIQGVCAST